MKTNRTLTLSVLLSGGLALQAYCQPVILGGATFDESSSSAPAEKHNSLTMEVVRVFKGYGDYAGFLKMRKCSVSQVAVGVDCVKCTTSGASEISEASDLIMTATGALVSTSEECWMAFDTAGNLRVLKFSRGGVVSFEASDSADPPVLIPASPAVAQTWDVLGKKMTVVALDASVAEQNNLLKIKVEESAVDPVEGSEVASGDAEFEYRYYKAGVGLVAIESGASDAAGGSGWSVKQ